jgi:WD40 repeat protein
MLASGGGSADGHIRFWNTHTLSQQESIDTGSQVCNLVYSRAGGQLVSTHGYAENQITVWSQQLKKVQQLKGH